MLQFMQGRYGVDQLSTFLIWSGVVISLITVFFRYPILTLLSWLLIIYAYVRIFSKQISKRYRQNEIFLDKTYGIRNVFANLRYRVKYGSKTAPSHHIYKCRKCGQKIRIPAGRGKIMVTCPKCHYQFKKRS
jgi:DNA-directed RNA polymerase subunit RPC12/RpoP